MTDIAEKIDPIRDRYYAALKIADAWADGLFYATAPLAFVPFAIDRTTQPGLYNAVQVLLFVAALAMFALGLLIRLYLSPKAEDMRRRDLLSKAYRLSLTHEQTSGYYNNQETVAERFIAAAVLENAFHTKAILEKMAWPERMTCCVYLLCFFIVLLYQFSDLAVATTAAVAIFSEQVVSRYARLEWLRIKSERTYDSLYALLQTEKDEKALGAHVLAALTAYEAAKASAGVSLSERVFLKHRDALAEEWGRVRTALGL